MAMERVAVRPDAYTPRTLIINEGRPGGRSDQDEIKQRLAKIAGRNLSEEHDHALEQGGRDTRGSLADVLGKARADDQAREKNRVREREQKIDEERKRQRELDKDLGWEL